MKRAREVHVLLVDDDVVDVKAVKRAFAKHGLENPMTIAKDGQEALHILRGEAGRPRLEAPYVILLDLNMPRMNGLELLDVLRSDVSLRRAVVFVLTTSAHDQDKLAAYDRNVAGYVLKSQVGSDGCRLAAMLRAYCELVSLP